MQLKAKIDRDPPPTNMAFVGDAEKASFDDDLEKTGHHPSAHFQHSAHVQQRASPEAERAVVRKLDWRVSCPSNPLSDVLVL